MFENPRDVSDESWGLARAKWDGILNKMIQGFKAYQRIKDLLYEEELGPYPLWRPKDMTPGDWEVLQNDRYQKSETLEKRDRELFKQGAGLFIEHFESLWD